MNRLFVTLLCLTVFSSANCSLFRRFYTSNEKYEPSSEFGELKEAHYFTEHLEKNDLRTARSNGLVNLNDELASSSELNANFISYAGYFTVNKECNSNLYTWFFKNKNESAPVLLWLQGGPGGSSMFGLFTEIGPYYVDKDLHLQSRNISWANDYSIFFVDNPVGTGFSYTGKDECYATNQTQVSNDLFSLLTQFFTTFPELKNNEFYLTGESYAGKYIPYLAYTIHQRKEVARKYFNFKGVAIGDGYTDPINQMNYAPLLYQIGLIDENQKVLMKMKQQEIAEMINSRRWTEAFDKMNELIDGDLGTKSMFTNFTGLTYYFNFLKAVEPKDQMYFMKYLNQPRIRELINVGNHTFNDGSKVETFMKEDVTKSVADQLVEVIRNYKVLLYNGQLDIIVAPVCTESFLQKLKWEGINSYLKAPRKIWKVNSSDEEPAGYIKSVVKENRQFHYAVVRNAGHILPHDKPREAYDLLRRFINNQLHQD